MPTMNGPSGQPIHVNDDNRGMMDCVSQSIEHHINHVHKRSFNVLFNQSPTAADDCIFYMVNNSDTNDIVVESLTLGFKDATAVDAEFYVQIGDKGTRNGATDITPATLNSGGPAADCTAEQGADLDGGAATLTGGTEVARWLFADVQNHKSSAFTFEQDLVLPKNETITLWATDAGATYYCTVHFNFHSVETGS